MQMTMNKFNNEEVNSETWYRVVIYNCDEIVEDVKIQGIKAAEEYGNKRRVELGKGIWYHIKVD